MATKKGSPKPRTRPRTRLVVKSPLRLSAEERRACERLSFGKYQGNMCVLLKIAIMNKEKRSRVALVHDVRTRKLLAWALIVSPLRGYRSPKISAYTRASHRGRGLGREAVEALLSKAAPLYEARPLAEKWDTASAEFWGSFGRRLRARCPSWQHRSGGCPCYLLKYDGALVFTIQVDATS